MADTPSRILVVKLSALGDLFHAVPVVHLLKEATGATIDWVTQPEYMELVACHQDVDRVLAFPRRGGLSAWRDFWKELREPSYDWAIDLQGLAKSGLVLAMARADRKLAPSHAREFSQLFANERASQASGPHAMDRCLDSLRHLDVPTEPIRYPLTFPPTAALEGQGPWLGLAPKSRWPAKDWPAEHFVELVRELRKQRDWSVVLIGGPDDKDLCDRLAKDMGGTVVNSCGQRPLLELGSLLRQVAVLVSNDSGPMHFAAAVGTPLVALFGPTDPAKTGPWGEGHRVLRAEPGPEGYPDHRSYKEGNTELISRIDVVDVVNAVQDLAGQGG